MSFPLRSSRSLTFRWQGLKTLSRNKSVASLQFSDGFWLGMVIGESSVMFIQIVTECSHERHLNLGTFLSGDHIDNPREDLKNEIL